MENSTAWESGYFDKVAPGDRHREAPPMVSQQTPPTIYTEPDVVSKKATLASIILRVLTFLLAIVAFILLLVSNDSFRQTNSLGNTTVKDVTFSAFPGFTYLLAVCCIVAVYSFILIVVETLSLFIKKLMTGSIVAGAVFVFDQIMAYILISAASTGADSIMITKDQTNITGFKFQISCSDLGIEGFCTKVSASVAFAFIAFLFMAITAGVSARRLFKLP